MSNGQPSAITTRRGKALLRGASALLAATGLLVGACTSAPAPAVSAPTTAPATAATAAPATTTASAAPAPTAAAAPGALSFPGPRTEPKIPILGAIPNSSPRAAAPAPTGPTPAPPTPPPARAVPIYMYYDTVTAGNGESRFNVDANLTCVKTSAFSRGMHIVWRVELVDATAGRVLQAADVRTAVLKVPTGDPVTLRYGRHGTTADAPWFWTAAWDVPMTQPLGVVTWSIDVTTVAGRTVTLGEQIAVFGGASDTRLQVVN